MEWSLCDIREVQNQNSNIQESYKIKLIKTRVYFLSITSRQVN